MPPVLVIVDTMEDSLSLEHQMPLTFQYSITDVDGNVRSPGTFTNNVGIRSTNLPMI